MRVFRGRASEPETDHERTRALVDRVADSGERAVRVWAPPRQVAFGRRDRRSGGYERAREAARERGYAPVERDVGGRAVAFTGETLAFALAEPVADHRRGIRDRYERVLDDLQRALSGCGLDAERGEPPDSFCPGTHSLQVDGRKVAGLAQRVRQDAAVVAGVLVTDPGPFVDVLAPVYDGLGVPFDSQSVGSAVPPEGTFEDVRDAVEDGLVGDRAASVTRVRDT